MISNYAWTIYNFRTPLIKKLLEDGYDISILTQFDGYEKNLEELGCSAKHLFISRKGINPFVDIFTFFHILIFLWLCKPFCCLTFTIKPVIYTSLAVKLLKCNNIAMITGLGTAFLRGGWLTYFIKKLYRNSLAGASYIFFQNIDDKNLFLEENLVSNDKCRLTPGSGIDLSKYKYSMSEPTQHFRFLLIARMVWDKGIREFVDASKLLHKDFPNTQFHITGPSGVQNRTAVSNSEIENWKKEGVVEYQGEVKDVRDYIKGACCIVLPSYREGTSRVLLEAAAIGRPIVTTNVPGCKELVLDGESGFLCEEKNSNDLYLKMEKMISLPLEQRNNMGMVGRNHIENNFNHNLVCKIYQDALSELNKKNS